MTTTSRTLRTSRDVLPRFAEWVGNAALVAHNGFSYDFKILDRVGAEMGISFAGNAKYDTILMSVAWHEKAGTRSKLNLTAMCKEFGIELTNAHRAYYDTVATAQLFIKLSGKDGREQRLADKIQALNARFAKYFIYFIIKALRREQNCAMMVSTKIVLTIRAADEAARIIQVENHSLDGRRETCQR